MENIKEKPVLLDKIIQGINFKLSSNLSWLNHTFGRVYKSIEEDDEHNLCHMPVVYNGNGEYLSVMPNDEIGNFSWFDIYDPQYLDTTVIGKPMYEVDGAIVFWVNISTIYNDGTVLHTEEIKNEIINALLTPGLIKLNIRGMFENISNVYKGFNGAMRTEYLLYPYYCLRIEFNTKSQELC